MDNIGTGHFIFAGIFIIAFIIGMIYAYRSDFKRSQWYFKGASWIIIAVALVIIFVVLVNKMLHGLQ